MDFNRPNLEVALRFRTFAISSLLFCAVEAPAEPMHPASKWNLDYGYTQCSASRDFANKGARYTLAFRPPLLGDVYELVISKDGSGSAEARESEAVITFDSQPQKAMILTYGLRSPTPKQLSRYHLPSSQMMIAKGAKVLSFDARNAPKLSFATGDLTALYAALDSCTADLRKFWNDDIQNLAHTATPSKGDLRAVFKADDYPAEALTRLQQGSGQYVLLIDETGRVVDCLTYKSSGIPIFDVRSCQIIRERAKFSPARDPSGKTIRSLLVTPPITFAIDTSTTGTRTPVQLPIEQYPKPVPDRE
ncbi:MAG: energy transducer TonB [Sphingomicrobium sp.]